MFKRPARILFVADASIAHAVRRAAAIHDERIEARTTIGVDAADLAWADLVVTLDQTDVARLPPLPAHCRHRPWPLTATERSSNAAIETAIGERIRAMRGGLRLLDRLDAQD
ncbi:MAG: hypothetical protein RBT51_04950 [Ectothiorhodospiraceae bacterium]|jgi:hypothetical protein|nr:hypothetical protein [Ectothiorhodospiraceae bacterium]